MRSGQKGFHAADIDGIAALDAAHDMPFYNPVVFLHVLKLVKDLHAFGFLEGKSDRAVLLVFLDHKDINLVAFLYCQAAVGVQKFRCGNLALGFEIHIDKNIVAIDADNCAFGYGAFLQIAEVRGKVVFKGAFKIHFLVPGFLICHLPCLQIISRENNTGHHRKMCLAFFQEIGDDIRYKSILQDF